MSIQSALAKGNILRTAFPSGNKLPLYLGSGDCGVCFDGFGLMNDNTTAASPRPDTRIGETMRLNHRDCYRHGNYGIDCWLGVYQLRFADGLPTVDAHASYEQTLDLYDGCLTTAYTLADGTRMRLRSSFHPYVRDVLAVEVVCDGVCPDLLLRPESNFWVSYGQYWHLESDIGAGGFTLHTGTVDTEVRLEAVCREGAVTVVPTGEGLRIRGGKSKSAFTLFIGTADSRRVSVLEQELQSALTCADWFAACRDGWHKRYGQSYADVPDAYTAMMWARSLYYVLCSFAPDGGIPSAPMGWTGYGWYFHFPQDVSYIHPALLRLGHIDIAKSIVEFYRRTLDTMEQNTARIYGGRGAMWAWEYPIHNTPDLLTGEAPNPFQFEIHNAAYPARMAYETARFLHDDEWTEAVAKPIIRASAEFYASHLVREDNGRWSLHVIPAMSQDENAEPNQKNYLCALYSARYTFTAAVKCGMSAYARYLTDGLSFDRLLCREQNLYYTSEGMTNADWGRQKHPVQLNPLVFLPAVPLEAAEKNAFARRAFICSNMQTGHYDGWTLTCSWLAAAHSGDGEALAHDIPCADRPDYTDSEHLGYYETSGVTCMPYYVTSHGFLLQAVCDAFVNPYTADGQPSLCGAVPASWCGAVYENLFDADGVPHSGQV